MNDNQKSRLESKEKRLFLAVSVNIALTVAQVIGGLISGSLSLISDALHNFSDAASLLLALIALKIGRKKPSLSKTFGYQRAETVAALINYTTLIIIGLFLMYEAVVRFFSTSYFGLDGCHHCSHCISYRCYNCYAHL